MDQATNGLTGESLIADLNQRHGEQCHGCRRPLCHHGVLMSVAIGYKTEPRCLRCLATAFTKNPSTLGEQLFGYIQARECYREAWAWANQQESCAPNGVPPCVAWAKQSAAEASSQEQDRPGSENVPASPAQAEWDAGQMACGELVLELRIRLEMLPPAAILKLRAMDSAAPQDLPAWCRLTGHRLLLAAHPNYWIRRKD